MAKPEKILIGTVSPSLMPESVLASEFERLSTAAQWWTRRDHVPPKRLWRRVQDLSGELATRAEKIARKRRHK